MERIAAVCALLLAGCKVGPDFRKPAAPDIPKYTKTVPQEQLFPIVDHALAQWWKQFGSDALNGLVDTQRQVL